MTEYEATEIKIMDSRQVFPICKRSGKEIKTGEIYVEVMVLSDSPRKKQRFEQWLAEKYIEYLEDKEDFYTHEVRRFSQTLDEFRLKQSLSSTKNSGADETSKVETGQQYGG